MTMNITKWLLIVSSFSLTVVTGFSLTSTSTSPSALTRKNYFRALSSSAVEDDITTTVTAAATTVATTTVATTTVATTPTTPSASSYLDDGFVFGLEGSGIDRPKGKVAQIVVEGDTLETQPYQVAMVTTTFLLHSFIASTTIQNMYMNHHEQQYHQYQPLATTSIEVSALTVAAYILADLGSGILHWSVDNYGNGRTPIMGGIIAAFQGHHSAPWTITERGFCNNVYKLCIPFGPIIPGLMLVWNHYFINNNNGDGVSSSSFLFSNDLIFFTVIFCVLEILSQEFHKWSHMTKSQVPKFVNVLQEDMKLTIGRVPHAQHHLQPYEGQYCIISGICNPFLDDSGFFRRLEHMIYKWNGVESNAWKLDSTLKQRTLAGDYRNVAVEKQQP